MASGSGPWAAPPPLLGRRSELAALGAALDGARAGLGRLFLVAGEGGVGKTRLAQAFVEESQPSEVRAAWGSCREAGGASPFLPWVELLRVLLLQAPADVVLRDLGAGGPDLARLVPELSPCLPGEATGPPDPASRLRLFESVVQVLTNVAGDGGLLVVLDDLHAADRGSLLLLRHVAPALAGSGVVLVGTYRDAEARSSPTLHRLLADIARYGRRIVMGGLDVADVAALLCGASGRPVDDETIGAVYELTDGNPFFVQEAGRVLDSAGGSGPALLPDDVSALVPRRLGGIGPRLSNVLSSAAILGGDFDLEMLARASGTPSGEVGALVGEAATLGLLGTVSPDRWAYTHTLVREAVRDRMRPSERVALHRKAGEAIEADRRSDEHLAALAHHFYEAARGGDGADAVRYCSMAGAAAVASLAFEEAATQFSRALDALAVGPPVDEHRRGELLLALGDAHLRAGEPAQAADAYRRALRAARAAGSPVLLAHAALGFAGVRAAGSEAITRGVLEEARAVLPEEDTILLARVLVALGAVSDSAGVHLSDTGLAMARRIGDETARCDVLDEWLALNRQPDRLALRLDVAAELRRLAARTDDPRRRVVARQRHGELLLEAGDLGAALTELLSAAAAEAAALRLPTLRTGPTALLAAVALLEGRLDEADALGNEARALGGGTSAEVDAGFQSQLWALRREQGRFDEMAEAARRLGELVPDAGRSLAQVMAAVASAEAGDAEGAGRVVAACVHELLEGSSEGRIAGAALVAEVSWLLVDRRWAPAAYDVLERWSGHHVVIGPGTASLGSSDRYLGQLAALADRYEDGERHFEAARAQHRRLGAPGWLAHGEVDHARMLLRQGGPAPSRRARQLLEDAQGRFRSLGMFVHERRAATLAGGSGDGPSAGTGEAAFRLEGEYWVLEFGSGVVRLPESKGLRYLARLIANPGHEIHALDLVAGVGGGGRTTSRAAHADGLDSTGGGDAGAMLDATAKAAYKERVSELREAIDEAGAHNDVGRLERAQAEMDFLLAELSAAVGLGGRDRKAASDAERARQSVTRAIKSAVSRVTESHPSLGEHLRTTVRTGIYASYSPDPAAPIEWKVSAHRS